MAAKTKGIVAPVSTRTFLPGEGTTAIGARRLDEDDQPEEGIDVDPVEIEGPSTMGGITAAMEQRR